jgi:hypothetical protein
MMPALTLEALDLSGKRKGKISSVRDSKRGGDRRRTARTEMRQREIGDEFGEKRRDRIR